MQVYGTYDLKVFQPSYRGEILQPPVRQTSSLGLDFSINMFFFCSKATSSKTKPSKRAVAGFHCIFLLSRLPFSLYCSNLPFSLSQFSSLACHQCHLLSLFITFLSHASPFLSSTLNFLHFNPLEL